MNGGGLSGLLLALCFGASFLLSGMEAGVFALNQLRIRRLARNGKRSAQILNGFLEKPERFLWTILVGNTLANFLILGWVLAELIAGMVAGAERPAGGDILGAGVSVLHLF